MSLCVCVCVRVCLFMTTIQWSNDWISNWKHFEQGPLWCHYKYDIYNESTLHVELCMKFEGHTDYCWSTNNIIFLLDRFWWIGVLKVNHRHFVAGELSVCHRPDCWGPCCVSQLQPCFQWQWWSPGTPQSLYQFGEACSKMVTLLLHSFNESSVACEDQNQCTLLFGFQSGHSGRLFGHWQHKP